MRGAAFASSAHITELRKHALALAVDLRTDGLLLAIELGELELLELHGLAHVADAPGEGVQIALLLREHLAREVDLCHRCGRLASLSHYVQGRNVPVL